MWKADSGAIRMAGFYPIFLTLSTFNMIVIRVRIIPRISGSMVIKTVINATRVGGREIGRYLCARSTLDGKRIHWKPITIYSSKIVFHFKIYVKHEEQGDKLIFLSH